MTDTERRRRESVIAAELQRLARLHGGILQPQVVVAAARPDDSPLHESFQWDDTKAADQWRLQQARQMIRAVVIYEPVGDREVETRVFVSLTPDREVANGGYRLAVAVMSDVAQRQQLLTDALKEMQSFRHKYQRLEELARVFEAMDRVEEESSVLT